MPPKYYSDPCSLGCCFLLLFFFPFDFGCCFFFFFPFDFGVHNQQCSGLTPGLKFRDKSW